jgi:hypothetical protein
MVSKSDQIRALREAAWKAKLAQPAYASSKERRRASGTVNKESQADGAPSNLINTNAAYQVKWRKANTDLNRLRAREGMRKIRAQRDNANT